MPPATTRSEPRTGSRRSRPQQVAEAIKDWVMERGLQPGDRLPSEAELIDRFAMAKGTIREALRILEAQGLVKSRTGPGGGVFVHQVSEDRAAALLGNYFYFQRLSIDDIYAVRAALEPELAASLAGKLNEGQLAALEGVVARYAEPARDAEEERVQHMDSLRFHALLAELSDNALLRFLIRFTANMLSEVTVTRQLYTPPNPELWESGRDYQARLLAALRSGAGDEARAIMAAHMRSAHRLMRAQEDAVTRRFLPEDGMI